MNSEEKKIEIQENNNIDNNSKMKASIFIIFIVMVLFIIILCITSFLGTAFGKSIEIIVLVAIALVLGILLYRSNRS